MCVRVYEDRDHCIYGPLGQERDLGINGPLDECTFASAPGIPNRSTYPHICVSVRLSFSLSLSLSLSLCVCVKRYWPFHQHWVSWRAPSATQAKICAGSSVRRGCREGACWRWRWLAGTRWMSSRRLPSRLTSPVSPRRRYMYACVRVYMCICVYTHLIARARTHTHTHTHTGEGDSDPTDTIDNLAPPE